MKWLFLSILFAIFALAFGTHLNQANAGFFKNRKAGCAGVAAAACAPAPRAACSVTRVTFKEKMASRRDARRASTGCAGAQMAACAPAAMSACAGSTTLVAPPVEKERIPPPVK